MASQSLQLDDIMATLMSMGFEFNDCQEAVTNGKLTVQAAIDWILAGKPGNVVQPSLKLNTNPSLGPLQSSSNNPFVPANTAGLQGSSSVVSSSSQSSPMDVESNSVVSRTHLSEKQQQIKLDFEEKERQETKRKLHEEKLKKKQEKERILKEIQEDREKLRLTKQAKVEASKTATDHQASTPPEQVQASRPGPSQDQGKSDESSTNIQIRLPSGQMFRQRFPATATLNSVWDAVYAVIKTAMNAYSGFMQPFPRKDFTKEEMGNSLQTLGLVPSGSLVLKKKDVQQATGSDTQRPVVSRDRLPPVEREAEAEEEEAMDVGGDNLGVHWRGPGGRLLGQHDFEAEEGDGGEFAPPADEDMAEDALGENPFDQIPGLGAHPILGNHLNGRGPRNQQVFEGFGNRLVPEGVPGDDTHLNRRAGEMAAQAAAQRFAQAPAAEPVPPSPSVSSTSQRPSGHLHCVRSLQDLSMCTLARCLTDPRKPFLSLSGLPEELLQTFLKHLMKERMLKPKLLVLMPSYLLKLVFDYYPYMTNEMLNSARIFVHLHTLSLNSCTLITDAGLDALKNMTALKNLNLSGCSQITNQCFTVLSALPAIQSLVLETTAVTDQGVIQFAYSGVCPNLMHLDLSRTAITQEILPSLQGFKKLKSLFLKGCMITGLAGIEGVSNLETIDLSETHILTDSVLCLTRLPQLVHVSLTGTQFVQGDRALSYLKDMRLSALYLPSRSSTTDLGMAYISGFPLSSLDLTNYVNVGDDGMEHIGRISCLKKLLLTNTKVSDQGIQHLKGLLSLEVLNLDRTRVSNASGTVIACLKNLCELSLSATNLSGDLIKQGHLNKCLNLTKLNLSRTIVGDKGIVCLELPNLELLNLDCTRVHHQSVPIIHEKCPSLRSVTLANLSSVTEDQGEEN